MISSTAEPMTLAPTATAMSSIGGAPSCRKSVTIGIDSTTPSPAYAAMTTSVVIQVKGRERITSTHSAVSVSVMTAAVCTTGAA